MVKYISVLGLLAMMWTSCLNKKNSSTSTDFQVKLSLDNQTAQCLPDAPEELSSFERMDILPIDLKMLKNKYEKSFTSGVDGTDESKFFYRPAEEGFYGTYMLFDWSNEDITLSGIIRIFNNIYPWYYDNDTDIFIELTSFSPDIQVFEDIHVGTRLEKLRDKFGRPNYEKDGIQMYVAKEKKLIALFGIEHDKIKWLRVGYYNDIILNDPKAHIDVLAKTD